MIVTATAYEGENDMEAIRAIRNVRHATGCAGESATECREALNELKSGEEIVVTVCDDKDMLDAALKDLDAAGITGQVVENEAYEARLAEDFDGLPEPSYEACKIALILLVHCGGNPTIALSAAEGQARVLGANPASEISAQAAEALRETFTEPTFA